ncbi:GntR family transcriptional regulator [Fusibacter ferrireducens]|nr:GntR family transcriptional regulator [Fusibacter ferrireducens]
MDQTHAIEQDMKLEIADYIIGLIQRNQMAAHDRLPSENELAKRFGVNRNTVRRAMDYLKARDRIYAQKGKGLFVAPSQEQIVFPQINNIGFSEIFQNYPYQYESKLLKWSLVRAKAELSRILEIQEGELIYKVKFLRSVQEKPLAVCISRIPQKMVPDLQAHLTLDCSINHILKQVYHYEHPVCKFVTAEAVMPLAKNMKLLEVNESVPMLKQISRFDVPNVGPVEHYTVYARGDRFKLDIQF